MLVSCKKGLGNDDDQLMMGVFRTRFAPPESLIKETS